MQPHSTETMTERTTGASPPLSQSAKRKREEENEEDVGSSSSKLCELWTADGGVCRDIWRTHVVKYLNRSDRKFFYSVNKGTRKAMKETMKEFFSAEANSDKKKELEDKLNQLKQRLKDLIEKKREITKAFAINKQKE